MSVSRAVATTLLLAIIPLTLGACGRGATSPSPSLVAIGDGVQGPAGLHASRYASGMPAIAALAFDPQGRLWAATAAEADTGHDAVYVIAAQGAMPRAVITNMHTPLGLLWYRQSLYAASTGEVDAYSDFDGSRFLSERRVVTLPPGVGESNQLVLAPDGRMLLGISADCDHCAPSQAMSGAIVSFSPEGGGLQLWASKIRAPVGLLFVPGTDNLLVTMNQRDDLGAATPGDWLSLVREGESWGFPGCYGQGGAVCEGVPAPIAVLDPHAAVAGVAVLPAAMTTDSVPVAAVAEWARDTVRAVPLQRDASGYMGHATTWLTGLDMPVPVVVGPDGAVYVGDWGDGTVVRVSA